MPTSREELMNGQVEENVMSQDAAQAVATEATGVDLQAGTVVAETAAPRTSAGRTFLKALALVVGVVVLLAAFNYVMTFALEPYGSKSEVMWQEYRAQDQVDMVYVGTSRTERSFDPAVIDKALGTHSFNMGTPNQAMEEALIGVQTAYKDYRIKQAVLGLDYFMLADTSALNMGSAYLRQRSRVVPAPDSISALGYFVVKGAAVSTDSLNWPLPWLSNTAELTVDTVKKNMKMKTDGTTVVEAAAVNEPGWKYFGQGYGNYKKSMDYDGEKAILDKELSGLTEFNPVKVQTFKELCDFCAAHDIELTVVGIPQPAYNIMDDVQTYMNWQTQVEELVEPYGLTYYNFGMAKPELLGLQLDMFADSQHLNKAGGEAFSLAFARLMDMQDAGQATDGLFYTVDEYPQTIRYVGLVTAEAFGVADGIRIDALATAGPGVEVEYRYLEYKKKTKDYAVLSDWSDEASYVYQTNKQGVRTLKVEVRQKGSNGAAERSREVQILY